MAQWLSAWLETEGPRARASPASLRCGPWARRIYPSLVLVQPRNTRPCFTERLLMGHKESNQTKNRTVTSHMYTVTKIQSQTDPFANMFPLTVNNNKKKTCWKTYMKSKCANQIEILHSVQSDPQLCNSSFCMSWAGCLASCPLPPLTYMILNETRIYNWHVCSDY